MAKKKTDSGECSPVDLDSLGAIQKDIERQYGEGFLVGGNDILNEDQMIIPVSPAIDAGLSGGVPEGSWIVFTGPPKFGKTTNALTLASHAQQEKYGSREVYYLDVEGRLKKMNLTGIAGLNLDKFHLIRSTSKKILSAEDYLGMGLDILSTVPGCILIVDSFSALCSETEFGKEMNEDTRGGSSKIQAKFCRKAANIVPINKNIIIGITHIQANVSGYGAPTMEKTSNSLAYQADIKLKATKREPWIALNKQIGQIVTWKTEVSALGPPGAEIQNYIRYGQGVDALTETIIIATDLGIINKPEKSSWYSFTVGGKEEKIQGLESVYAFLQNNPSVIESISNEIKTLLA